MVCHVVCTLYGRLRVFTLVVSGKAADYQLDSGNECDRKSFIFANL